jgi:hypothetical protein
LLFCSMDFGQLAQGWRGGRCVGRLNFCSDPLADFWVVHGYAFCCVVAGISSADFVEPSGSSVAGRRVRHRDPAGFGLGCWSCVVLSSVSFCLSCSVER